MAFLVFIVSLGASILGAISGIGGGVIIKPVMDSLNTFSVSTINFLTSCTVLSMTAATLLRNRKSEVVLDKRISTILAIGGIIGGILGNQLFSLFRSWFANDAAVGMMQYILLILLTSGVLVFTVRKEAFTPRVHTGFFFTLLTGLLLGAIASFLGIGGGPINIAILYLLFSMDSKKAALNSIYIIFFSQTTNVLASVVQRKVPEFDPLMLALMVIGGVSGGCIGSAISKKLTLRGVDMLFSVVMGIIILISIYNLTGFAGGLN